MYGQNDLRTTLVPASKAPPPASFKRASYAHFYADPPVDSGDLIKTWYARGATMVVAYSEVEPGAVFTRSSQPDEYAVVIPDDGVEIEISIAESTEIASGRTVSFVPAGASKITVLKGGRILRLFTAASADLVAKCPNAGDYAEPDPNVAPPVPWPDPVGGRKVRVYSGNVAPEQGRFGESIAARLSWSISATAASARAPQPTSRRTIMTISSNIRSRSTETISTTCAGRGSAIPRSGSMTLTCGWVHLPSQ